MKRNPPEQGRLSKWGARLPRWLLAGIRGGLGLLLLTPLVVTTETVFPYVVGKAVYARSLIEVVFALWSVLALMVPSYRPPRSRLLTLLGVGVLVSLAAAAFGVSPQRSLWSNYERMGGVIDMAHWFALALVLAAVVRSPKEWRVLINLNLAVAFVVALLVVASSLDIRVPFYGDLVERDYPRRAASLGNASYQGAYIWVNMILALGCIARSFVTGKARPGRYAAVLGWGQELFWVATVVLAFWAFNMSGSYGALTGLVAALGSVCMIYAVLGQAGEVRRFARLGTSALVASVAAFGVLFFSVSDNAEIYYNALMERLLQMDLEDPSVQTRLLSWQTGLQAFVERPFFGWGPDNYAVAFGRHVGEAGAVLQIHDRAHNELIERAATEGALGVAAYVALWVATFFVIGRAARRLGGAEGVLPAFVGAALIGDFVQGLSLFESQSNTLQYILLLSFVVAVEGQVCPPGRRWSAPAWLVARLGPVWRRRELRTAAGVLAVALSVVALAANARAHAAARAAYVAFAELEVPRPTRALAAFEQAVTGFAPLANGARQLYFALLGDYWISLRAQQREAATRILRRIDAEAAKAVAVEPENWRIRQALARFYRVVAQTEPGYSEKARCHAARFAELSPGRGIDDVPPAKGP